MKHIYSIIILLSISVFSSCEKSSSESSGATATNGSLTRFVIAGNYLYTISNDALNVYNITSPSSPVFSSKQYIGFAIQTIFAYQDKLFIGSNEAMYIYSLDNPGKPTQQSEVTYFVRGIDPVVAEGPVAYSTVRSGFNGSVLNVFNIQDISNPIRLQSLALTNPYGLGIKNEALYVCEAENGMSVFDISKPYEPAFVKSVDFDETAYDVIIQNDILICYIRGGIAFFDIADMYDPVLISKVKN